MAKVPEKEGKKKEQPRVVSREEILGGILFQLKVNNEMLAKLLEAQPKKVSFKGVKAS